MDFRVFAACAFAKAATLAACAGAPEPREVPRAPTAAEVLVADLPPGADHCVVARPGRLAPSRRRQLAPLSAATAFAWDSDAPVAVVVEARRDGRGAPATELRLRVSDLEAARAWLAESAPFRVRWMPPGACVDPAPLVCRGWRAHAPDARTLRLRRGLWRAGPAQALGEGHRDSLMHRCRALAGRFPQAHEVAVHTERTWRGAWDLGEGDPSSFREVVVLPLGGDDGAGVRWREVIRGIEGLPPEVMLALAEGAAAEPPFVESSSRQFGPAMGPEGLESAADYRWEDLALALEDARRLARAASAAAAASVPLDPERVAVEDLEVLARQLRLHRRAAETRGDRTPLRDLLRRGLAAHPEDAELAQELAEELVRAGDGEALIQLADAWAESEGGPRWELFRRQGRALSGEGLAAALEGAGIARGGRARTAAAVLSAPALARHYEDAEGAWRAADALARAPVRLGAARAVLARDGLLESLVALAEGDGEGQGARAVFIRLEQPVRERGGDPVDEAGVLGTARTRLFRWREGDRQVHVGATRTDDPLGVSTLAALIARALDGASRLRVAVVPFGGDPSRPEGVVEVQGQAEGPALRLRRASAGPRWASVSLWLAEPFAALPVRTFPRPRFRVVAPSAAIAEDVARRASVEPALECARDGAALTCAVSPERDRTRRAWLRSVPANVRF
ncbi:MAG: hypothetical protein AAF447_10280 [Myxococcota bacterium]